VDVTLRTDFLIFNEGEYAQIFGSNLSNYLPAYLPSTYMPEARLRISAYKEVAELISSKELKALKTRWTDRFGPPPPAVAHLLSATAIKLAAAQSGINTVEIREQRLMLTRNGSYITVSKKRFPRLTETTPEKKLNEARQMIESF
jgi:transcription-repair coupling factor (superfamily II helicase)